MEIYKIKRSGCEINVLFTGEQYIFQNSFFGLLAVATRKGYSENDIDTFTLEYGNENTLGGSLGGSVCETMAKRFIKQCESRYVERDTKFSIVKVDINKKYYIDIKAKER